MSPPRTRRKFSSDFDELSYLAQKLQYWIYERGKPSVARRFCKRFESILKRYRSEWNESIALQQHLALLYDAKDNLRREIVHQEQLVALLKRLWNLGGRVGPYDEKWLYMEMVILGTLYYDYGKYAMAQQCIREARQFAIEHGIEFDKQDTLDEVEQLLAGTELARSRRQST